MEVTLKDFAQLCGMEEKEISPECRAGLAAGNFKYRIAEGAERDALILEVLKKIDTDKQVIGAPDRTGAWERGWAENLAELKERHDERSLLPKYMKPGLPIRMNKEYVITENPMFELDLYALIRTALFQKYLSSCVTVYEFGSGTGFNLKAFADLYPKTELYGFDFVAPAAELADEIGKAYGINLHGRVFNMRKPDFNLKLKPKSGVFHFVAVEQLASDLDPLFSYFMENRPAAVLALEPTPELYDENNLIDYLGLKFHRKRGYSEGYLPRLKKLEAEKKIEILKIHRTGFGSMFHEGYTLMVWKPVV